MARINDRLFSSWRFQWIELLQDDEFKRATLPYEDEPLRLSAASSTVDYDFDYETTAYVLARADEGAPARRLNDVNEYRAEMPFDVIMDAYAVAR